MANRWGNNGNSDRLYFLGSKITTDSDHEFKRCLLLRRKAVKNLDSVLKGRDITLTTKVHIVKAMGFLVVMYRCESMTIKIPEHRRIDSFELVVLEKTLESPREIKPANPKANQLWMYFGRTDDEADAPILWPHDVKNGLIGKYPDFRKYWRLEKGMTDDEMVEWHHWLSGHEFEQILVDGEGQRSLGCCSLCGHKKSNTTEGLNNSIYSFWWRRKLRLRKAKKLAQGHSS